ncbi:hypothetical protein IFM89_007462 [Coptis chinensis]|uniref:Transketolase C-terminal domain-containing protein n=1 Tax=Coptis chinensis TaxID=261450 RepID=A0A835IAQ2_9MAGN|nr:hypothetical protein IFM89_007462 [Coptis chinensis]
MQDPNDANFQNFLLWYVHAPSCYVQSLLVNIIVGAFDFVVHDVNRQKVPVRFAISSAGLVELVNMVVIAAHVNDRPICFRLSKRCRWWDEQLLCNGIPPEIGKGRVLVEGKDVALLGYGVMVQNCLRARSLLASLGIHVTIADARFSKPLDIKLVRELCKEHTFLITVEERSMRGRICIPHCAVYCT